MKYKMEVIGVVLALLVTLASPAWTDVVVEEFPDPEAPETTPLLLAGLIFVLLVSDTSFALLRRMARRRAAIDPSQKGGAEDPPVSETED